MIRIFIYGGLVLAMLLSSCKSKNDQMLFTRGGKDWLSSGEAEWNFENDELIGYASDNAGFVMTEDQFSDFVLTLEFNPDETVNSGVFVRCAEIALSATDCYEFNIWDNHPNQDSRTGSIVGRTTALNNVHTLNQWNTYKIRCQGDAIQAWINKIKVVDLKNADLVSGHIGLQAAGKGTVRFRNVRIAEISD